MLDDDVERKPGIYPYVLDGDERHLNIRAFSGNMKREAYERQKGVCVKCKKKFPLDEMEADHIKPWHEGGKTDAKNCQMMCKDDNRRKSGSWVQRRNRGGARSAAAVHFTAGVA
jgi:5-methylcytosine-specific restriction endonuclease McrA